jgi:hypothetical protein
MDRSMDTGSLFDSGKDTGTNTDRDLDRAGDSQFEGRSIAAGSTDLADRIADLARSSGTDENKETGRHRHMPPQAVSAVNTAQISTKHIFRE